MPNTSGNVESRAHETWETINLNERMSGLGFHGWRARKTGVKFILPPTCEVPAGAFDMGSADDDAQAFSNEKPQCRIAVAAFAIGTYPVTVAEYAYFLTANPDVAMPGGGESDLYNWSRQQTRLDHPVVQVNWFNANDYAAWLAQTTSQLWRLPTEAEWEKAARWDEAMQHARIYPWGDTWDNTRANTWDSGPKRATAVGSYPSGASPYDCQDMAGNVWEWCSSMYQKQYPYDPAVSEDNSDANRSERTSVRVLRGGSWRYGAPLARAAFRGSDEAASGDLGSFRLVRS